MEGSGNITAIDSIFIKNSANSGGAISISRGAKFVLRNSTISDNIAYVQGGGLIFIASRVQLENVNIENNLAFEVGGGLSINYDSKTYPLVKNCTFR